MVSRGSINIENPQVTKHYRSALASKKLATNRVHVLLWLLLPDKINFGPRLSVMEAPGRVSYLLYHLRVEYLESAHTQSRQRVHTLTSD